MRLWLALLALVVAVAFGARVRIATTLSDPNFDAERAQGLLKSDPALLYYFVERIVESGGRAPPDFRADPRIEYPQLTDIPALFPVGQEFVIAWCRPFFGDGVPLHVVCLYVMSVCAAIVVVGVFGLAYELTGRLGSACFTAALWGLLPANYRTIGFLLVGEDFSLPWFALHLWLLARAVRVRTPFSVFAAALSLGVALSTWHALSFFAALEVACVFAWFLATDENPFASRSAWILPAALIVFACTVPVLRHTLFAGSLPMQMMLGLGAAAAGRRWFGGSRWAAAAIALGSCALVLLAATIASRALGAGLGEYAHVFALLWHKVVHLGVLPEDPRDLPFDVRLMWQGPFATLDVGWGLLQLGVGSVVLAWALAVTWRHWRERVGDRRVILLLTLVCVSIPVAYLIERTIILTGLLVPVAAASLLERISHPMRRRALGLLALGAQAAFFAIFLRGHSIGWYQPLPRAEIAALVQALPGLVPSEEAIAADFINSTAILAHTRNPIVVQPKYEARHSRERAEDFLLGFYERSPAELRRMLIDKYRCRFVLFDRFTLGFVTRYAGGLPRSTAPRAGTAAAVFLSQDPQVLASVPGYRLLYRSPPGIVQRDGSPTDFFRLYALEP